MRIREQIVNALTVVDNGTRYYPAGFKDVIKDAADLAEARERELLDAMGLLEGIADNFKAERDKLLADIEQFKSWLAKAENEKLVLVKRFDFEVKHQVAMMAELRGIQPHPFQGNTVSYSELQAIISKYEALK
jgi:hypothetical protein